MKEFMTVKQAAERWNISRRRVQVLCRTGRVDGAAKKSGIWVIPQNAEKPAARSPGRPAKDLRLVSLFSGCGGMDLGFEGSFDTLRRSVNPKIHPHWRYKKSEYPYTQGDWVTLGSTRFRTVFANDIVEDAKAVWVNYFKTKGVDTKGYCLDSVVDLVKLHKENEIDIFPQNVDIVTGGFPCQDFSIAGKRKGFQSHKSHRGEIDPETPTEENRGLLYIWMREVVAITQPKMFVAENVKGLTNLEDVKETIEADFASVSENGYVVVPAQVLHAADYGVPQSRERVIFYGFRKSALTPEALTALTSKKIPTEYLPYPTPTHAYTFEDPQGKALPFVTVGEVLQGLPEPKDSQDLSHQRYSRAKYMGAHCQGQTEVDLQGIGPTIRAEHHGNIEFRRLSKQHGGQQQEELSQGLKERRLSVRECARLQTFPDDYDFVIPAKDGRKAVSASGAYKLIGNAVPPLLGYHIAKRLEDNWERYFG